MSVQGKLHIDRAMTNLSVAYAQGADAFIADKVFPIIKVQKQSDVYFEYSKADFFADLAEERAKGTESAGGEYNISIADPYYCKVYAYHEMITGEDRANADQPINLDRDATEIITHKLLLKKETLWAEKYFKTGVWGTDIIGGTTEGFIKFDNDTSDPIKYIKALRRNMKEQTALEPNTIVMAPAVFDALCEHGDIIDRIKYTQKGIVTADLIAALFGVDKIYVASAVKNKGPLGSQTADMNFIMGKNLLLCHTNKAPGIKKASAGYTFAWTGFEGANALGGRITRIPMPWKGLDTERIEGEMAFDMRTICTDLGVFIENAVD